MKTTLFSSIIAVLALMLASTAQSHQLLHHLARYHCDGSFEILPSTGMGAAMRMPFTNTLLNSAIETVYKRAECLCGSDNTFDDDFNLMYDPMVGVFNDMGETTYLPTSSCLQANFARSLLDIAGLFNVQMPSTCDLMTWVTTGHCSFEYCIDEYEVCFKVGLSQCTASRVPALAIACEGLGCTSYFSACRTSADCANGYECDSVFNLIFNYTVTDQEIADNMFDVFSWLYAPQDSSPGCWQATRGSGPRTPSNDIMARLTTFVYNNFFGWTGSFATPNICMSPFMIDLKSAIVNGTDFVMPASFENFINTTTVQADYPSCFTNDTVDVTFNYFTDFDGTLDDNTNLFNPPAIISTPAAFTNGVPIAHVSCTGAINIGNQMFMQTGSKVMPAANAVVSMFKDLASCRASPAWSTNQFIARYIPNTLFWLSLFDAQGKFNLGPDAQFHADNLRDQFANSDIHISNLPCSATLNHYLTEGSASLTWTGLSELFSMDLDIHVSLTECPGSAMNDIQITCVGAACDYTLGGVAPCDVNNDCMMYGSGFTCIDLIEELSSLSSSGSGSSGGGVGVRGLYLRNSTGSTNGTDSSYGYSYPGSYIDSGSSFAGALLAALGASDVDTLAVLLSTDVAVNENMCSNLNFSDPFAAQESTCWGPEHYRWDVHNMIMDLFGVMNAPAVSTPLHFCSIDTSSISGDRLSSWAESLVHIGNNNRIAVNYMTSDVDASCPATTPGGSGSSSLASMVSISWTMIVLMLTALLALYA